MDHSRKRSKVTDLRSSRNVIRSSSRTSRKNSNLAHSLLPAQPDQTNEQPSDVQFDQVIELFCEVLLLYREMFTQTPKPRETTQSSESHRKNPLPIEENFELEHSPKEMVSMVNDPELACVDQKKIKTISGKILRKLLEIKAQENSPLKSQISTQIESLSSQICFFLEEQRVWHGGPGEYESGGEGHLLDLACGSEYLGRVRQKEPCGKGQLDLRGQFRVQGNFDKGQLCGFGEKRYFDGSFYRYLSAFCCIAYLCISWDFT